MRGDPVRDPHLIDKTWKPYMRAANPGANANRIRPRAHGSAAFVDNPSYGLAIQEESSHPAAIVSKGRVIPAAVLQGHRFRSIKGRVLFVAQMGSQPAFVANLVEVKAVITIKLRGGPGIVDILLVDQKEISDGRCFRPELEPRLQRECSLGR